MADQDHDSPSILKFIGGVILGMLMTMAYVKYAWTMPTLLQVPGKITEAAVVTTAEMDLFDPAASDDVRQRAFSVVVAQSADRIVEIDRELGHPILKDLLRRRAEREARLLKHQMTAWDVAMDKPALRKALERKHGATPDDEQLKRRMMIDAIHDDAFLTWYLQTRFPQLSADEQIDHILTVYQHGLRTPEQQAAIDPSVRR